MSTEPLNLYCLTRTSTRRFMRHEDHVEGFVVVAPNRVAARLLASDRALDEGAGTWLVSTASRCEHIGTARPSMKRPRVIVREAYWSN